MERSAELAPILAALAEHPRLGSEVAHRLYSPPVAAEFAPAAWAGRLAPALATQGIRHLYRHQAEALAALGRDENALVTTPTASGKSLVFQLPPLEAAAAGESGRGLWLFPLKALGQDQAKRFRELAEAAGLGEEATCEIYDGDTPDSARARIRKRPPRVLITNPDMLHLGILPSAAKWEPFLADLRWIVLDELHVYRGIFGSHFHHVLGRLLRLARRFGARPRLVASSATAENAGDFAAALAGEPFAWIRDSGSPRSGRELLLLRPTGSPYTTALALFTFLVDRGMKTLAFTKARRITELLVDWLGRQRPDLARRIKSYRAGFLAGERREIERALASGELAGVISTSALELGIDIGGLDACVLVGYPGSRMATFQRAGRVGRGDRDGLVALVALPDALDQYLLDHPQELVERSFEPLLVDPDNEPVSRGHLVCAAAEAPLDRELDRGLLERHAALVGELLAEGELASSEDERRLVARRRRPQREIGLRGSGAEFAILSRGAVLGTIDGVRVYAECHPGAIYFHGGRQYVVRQLDLEGRRVDVEPAAGDFYTSALAEKETEVLEILAERDAGPLASALGRVRVTERVVGFERKQVFSQEVLDQQALDLPPSEFETVALWWRAPAAIEAALRAGGRHFLGALHAAEHATIGLLPLFALCDRNDIGGISFAFHPQLGSGGVFVYDGHAGGVGIAQRGFERLSEILAKVAERLAECACESGCPACVQSPKCGNGNRPLDKRGALEFLELALGRRPLPQVEAPLPTAATRALAGPSGRAAPPAERAAPRRSRATGRPRPAESPEAGEAAAVRPVSATAAGAAAAAGERRTILFDLETLRSAEEVGGWNKAHRMGVAVGVLLHLEEGRFEVYREERVAELVAALKSASLVVGFNSRRFDYAVLSGYTGEDFGRLLPTLDLLEDIHARLGFRLGLGHLAKETLGAGKSADGLQSLAWVREGRFDLVEDYCRRDVEVLRDLYLFGRREGYVLYADREGRRLRLPVDW
jgi:DEAD/DEAH box helicase domain-containing protein